MTVENRIISIEAIQKHLPNLEGLGYAEFVRYVFEKILYDQMLPGRRRNVDTLRNYLVDIDIKSEEALREAVYKFIRANE